MPPRKRTPAASAARPARATTAPEPAAGDGPEPRPTAGKPEAVFRHELVISTVRTPDPGPSNAAVLAAQQHGHVVVGEPHVEVNELLPNGAAHRVVWAVPIAAG